MAALPPRKPSGSEAAERLAALRTSATAKAKFAADEQRIHAELVKRARQHERVLAASREHANDRVIRSRS